LPRVREVVDARDKPGHDGFFFRHAVTHIAS
jgi:hypothetical protein